MELERNMRINRFTDGPGAKPQPSEGSAEAAKTASFGNENQHVAAQEPSSVRRVRSLRLAWRDEESGDELMVDVRGSDQLVEELRPLGFVPLGERPVSGLGQRLPDVHPVGEVSTERSAPGYGAPRRRVGGANDSQVDATRPASGTPRMPDSEVADHRVRWTVRLARPWNSRNT